LATERKLDHSSSCLSEEVREDAAVVDLEAVVVVRLFSLIWQLHLELVVT
jgi:hypothetical protein